MGDMADYYSDYDLSVEDELDRDEYNLEFRLWLQKNGKTIKVSKMSNEHIINTKTYLEKTKKAFSSELTNSWIEIFEDEMRNRGIR